MRQVLINQVKGFGFYANRVGEPGERFSGTDPSILLEKFLWWLAECSLRGVCECGVVSKWTQADQLQCPW